MKSMILALAMLAPLPAMAELALSDLVGTWTGQGTYVEGLSSAKMRCNLGITGTDAMVRLSGRCGSSLGAESVVLDFTKAADGSVSVSSGPGAPANDSKIDVMQGKITANQLILRGAAGDETVTIELLQNPNGSLHFATRRTWTGKKATSVVTLIRR